MAAKKEIEENTELKTVHEPQAFTRGGAAGFPPLPGRPAEKGPGNNSLMLGTLPKS